MQSSALPSLEQVRAINGDFPFGEPMRRWKDKGGKIVGWGCSYVPVEIIRAAGLFPVRVVGDAREIPTDDADAYLYVNACSYVRTVLQLGLDAQYDFLDGYVSTVSCDCMRRLFDMWRHYVTATPLVHIMTLPRKATPWAEKLFLEELRVFRQRLEAQFGVSITNDALREAIRTHNRTRQLLAELMGLRRETRPAITGAESLEVINAGIRMPCDEYNALLSRLIEEARARQVDSLPRLRLMVSGSNLANPDFIAGIEAQGALVVAEELCTGARYWNDLVEEDPNRDPMEALAHRYLNNFPCARTVGLADARYQRLLGLAKEYRVQGLVSAVIRNCVPNSFDRPLLREQFEDAGIAVLELDTEYGSGQSGQIATRVQAFLEMLHAQVAV